MNVFALSTVVRADAVDVENIMRRFERRAPKYPTIEHVGQLGKKRTYPLIPIKDNTPNADFNVDSMSTVEREALEEERQAELETAEGEGEAEGKAKDIRQNERAVQHTSMAIDKENSLNEVEEESNAGEEEQTGVHIGNDRKEDNGAKEATTLGFDEQSGAHDLDSITSHQSNSSIVTRMVEMEGKLSSMYTEQKLDPEPGWDLPKSYEVSLNDMIQLAKNCNMHDSDLEILEAMFRLVDSRGFEEADIRAVMVPLAICTCKNSVAECINLVLSLFDRAQTETIEKTQMLKIFNLINEGIMYVGDRPLDSAYVVDLVDSVFTSSGKIDGYINYKEYIELICEHPIVEMFLTPQYQGLARDKVFDKETLQGVEVDVNIDYSQKTV